jgi:hypothetical protein
MNNKSREFRFDISWLQNDEFLPIVSKMWQKHVYNYDPIDILNVMLENFNFFLNGWGSN